MRMRLGGLLALCVFFCALGQAQEKKDDKAKPKDEKPTAKSELKKVMGTWTIEKVVIEGDERPDADKRTWVVDNGTLITKYNGNKDGEAKLTFDPSKDPKTVDILWTVSASGGKSLGIYRWTDDGELEICYNQPKGPGSDTRPTAFTTKRGEEGRGSVSFLLKKKVDTPEKKDDKTKPTDDKATAKSELKKAMGTWTIAKVVIEGDERPDADKRTWVVDNGTLITKYNGNKDGEAKLTFDPSKNPKTVDILWVVSATGGKSLGIYRWTEDGELEICYNLAKGPSSDTRPTAFTTKKGEEGRGNVSFLLKKKEK